MLSALAACAGALAAGLGCSAAVLDLPAAAEDPASVADDAILALRAAGYQLAAGAMVQRFAA